MFRGANFLISLLGLIRDYKRSVLAKGKDATIYDRACWMQRSCQRYVKLLRIDLQVIGQPPKGGLMISNHLSWVDIIVLCASTPCVFISKDNVKRWPIFGYFAGLGGTLFVNREKRSDVGRLGAEMEAILKTGTMLALFPEGTSSGGASVLPFKSALLEPITNRDLPVTPTAVEYMLKEGGDPAEEVCYWADMTLVPHLFNVWSMNDIKATVVFGEPRIHKGDRKQLAKDLHAEVLALQNKVRGKEPACAS